jgi:activating signal cointegrator complex subunit 3
VSALGDPRFEQLYKPKFSFFNPIQTQVFHTLFHTDANVLVGAPTGSGKTIMSEFAMLRVFKETPKKKIIYIAPLKALAKERILDWKMRLGSESMRKSVLELTGDCTPDLAALKDADLLITTPEKWDGISRNWQHRSYVSDVALVIIDEIHLLGQDRGPVIEVIISRMRYIAEQTGSSVRFVGLSTALANAKDVADWLGI